MDISSGKTKAKTERNTITTEFPTHIPSQRSRERFDKQAARKAAQEYGQRVSLRNRESVEQRTKSTRIKKRASGSSLKTSEKETDLHRNELGTGNTSKRHIPKNKVQEPQTHTQGLSTSATSRVQFWVQESSKFSLAEGTLHAHPNNSSEEGQATEEDSNEQEMHAHKATQTSNSPGNVRHRRPHLHAGVQVASSTQRSSELSPSLHADVCNDRALATSPGLETQGPDLLSIPYEQLSIYMDREDLQQQQERDNAREELNIVKSEELVIKKHIQELKETRSSLLAERRVIQLRIEELNLKREVRYLAREVSKAKAELTSLSIKERKEAEQMKLSKIDTMPADNNTNGEKLTDMLQWLPSSSGTGALELGAQTPSQLAKALMEVSINKPSTKMQNFNRDETLLVESSGTERKAKHSLCAGFCDHSLPSIETLTFSKNDSEDLLETSSGQDGRKEEKRRRPSDKVKGDITHSTRHTHTGENSARSQSSRKVQTVEDEEKLNTLSDDGRVCKSEEKTELLKSGHLTPSVESLQSPSIGKMDQLYSNASQDESKENANYKPKAIKVYFSAEKEVKSAPAALFQLLHEQDYDTFVKASSYHGVEKLSGGDEEGDQELKEAFSEEIERLAGGRLDLVAGDASKDDSELNKSSSSSAALSVSYEDAKDQGAYPENLQGDSFIDSIPSEEEISDDIDDEELVDCNIVNHSQLLEKSTSSSQPLDQRSEIHLPLEPILRNAFPDNHHMINMSLQQEKTSEAPVTAVFNSPRSLRISPRSPRRQPPPEYDTGRNRNAEDSTEQPKTSSSHESGSTKQPQSQLQHQQQTQGQSSSVLEALVTASSSSSSWVQFSQTEATYIEGLVARFVKAFCDPVVPEYLHIDERPISLFLFSRIERELGGSYVQEAFDRAIFDSVNERLLEIYKCCGRVKKGEMSVVGDVWEVPSLSCLIQDIEKTVIKSVDCNADPFASYQCKECIIESLLQQDVKRFRRKQNPAPSSFFRLIYA